jgi:hypothetical protein
MIFKAIHQAKAIKSKRAAYTQMFNRPQTTRPLENDRISIITYLVSFFKGL